ncbi:MAG: sugar-binding domain-containing protein, partial [Bacteroidota bacterium]
MKNLLCTLLVLITTYHVKAQYVPEENFNKNWLFYNEAAEGAENPDFDDSKWRKLNLPHDWAIEGPFDRQYDSRMGGLPVHGTGWYRKRFTLPESAKDKIVRIEFEGAMYDAHVWVNGEKVGNRPYGYIGFEFDITKHLKFDGSENVIAVRLTPEDYSSRWYPGAGLYRSVWLKVDEPVYI